MDDHVEHPEEQDVERAADEHHIQSTPAAGSDVRQPRAPDLDEGIEFPAHLGINLSRWLSR